jgi:hypothetical protein
MMKRGRLSTTDVWLVVRTGYISISFSVDWPRRAQ